MASVLAKTMLESAIAVGDWVLSCQQIRKPSRYDEIFGKLYSSFSESRADEDIYLLFLAVLDDVFDILAEGQINGSIKAGTAAPDGNTEHKIEVEKSFPELLREAEDFFMFLLVFSNTLDMTAEASGRPGGAHTYNVIVTLGTLPKTSDNSKEKRPLFEDFRLKIMMCGCDVFPPQSPFRHKACLQVVQFAAEHNLFDKIIPCIGDMEQWVQKDVHMTSADRRYLYGVIASQLRQRSNKMDKQQYPFVLHIVEEFDKEPSDNHAGQNRAIEAAVDLVSLAIGLMNIVTFDDLVNSKTVQRLSSTPHAPLLQLANIFYDGDHNDFLMFKKEHPGIFEKYNLDAEACFDKIQLLTLASLASSSVTSSPGSAVKSPRLSLKELAERLQLSLSDAESLAVRAISLGIIDAQIDQMTSEIAIRSSLQRSFGRMQWIQLAQRLMTLNQNITQILSHLEKH